MESREDSNVKKVTDSSDCRLRGGKAPIGAACDVAVSGCWFHFEQCLLSVYAHWA